MANLLRRLTRSSSSNIMKSVERSSERNSETLADTLPNTSSNSAIVAVEKIENNLMNWDMPKYEIKQIYKSNPLGKKNAQIIKVSEDTYNIGGTETETIELLNQNDIRYLRLKGFKYLHIAAIQIAIQPLSRLGLNILVLVCLRDARFLEFEPSLLAIMESNLLGPIYFDCFPNIRLDCQTDGSIHKSLTVHVQTKGPKMDPLAKNLALRYRVYYKAMPAQDLSPKALNPTSIKDQTMMYQGNLDNTRVTMAKPLSWNKVISGNDWVMSC